MRFDIAKERPEKGLEPFVLEFLNDREAEFKQLQSFILNKDFKSVEMLAHSWKGFSAPYGFLALGELSKELEAKAAQADITACSELIDLIKEYLLLKRAKIA